MENQEEHIDIRDRLRKLPKMKASENFLNSLYNEVNKIEAEKHHFVPEKKKSGFIYGWFEKFVDYRKNAWAIPAIGFSVVAVVVISIALLSNNNQYTIQQSLFSNKDVQKSTDTQNNSTPGNISNEGLNKKDIAGDLKTQNDLNKPNPDVPKIDQKVSEENLKTATPTDELEKTGRIEMDFKKTISPPENSKGVTTDKKEPARIIEQNKTGNYYDGKIDNNNKSNNKDEIDNSDKNVKGDINYKKNETRSIEKSNKEKQNNTDVDVLEKLKEEMKKTKTSDSDQKNDKSKDNKTKKEKKKTDNNTDDTNKTKKNTPPPSVPPTDINKNKTPDTKKNDDSKPPEKKNEIKKF